MVEYLLIWLVMPILLLLLTLGFGVLFSIVTKKPMNMVVCLATGFSLLVIIGSLLGMNKTLAPHAAVILAVIALFGLFISGFRFRSYIRIDFLSGLAGLITYVGFGLPVMAYGHPSWAGWVQLDDTASWFAVTDRLMSAGQFVPTSVFSTYERLIQVTFSGNSLNYGGVTGTHFSYPLGSFVPFGTVSKISGIEMAWVFQPFLAVAAAIGAMLFVLLLRMHTRRRLLLVVLSCVAMSASTIYSYVMWGGIKEIVLIVPLLLLSHSIFIAIQGKSERQLYLYSVIGVMALYFIGGATSLGFIAPILLFALLVMVQARNRPVFYAILTGVGVFSVAGIYALRSGNNALGRLFVPEIKDSGNLARPVNLLQSMGIWPSKDFRLDPILPFVTFFVIAVAFCFLTLGVYYSYRKGLWAVPALVTACICVVSYSFFFAGIWITGKAIAVTSPIFLLAAGIGAFEAWQRLNRIENLQIKNLKLEFVVMFLAVVIGLGVLLSDSYTYRNVWIAPYSQMNELRTIDKLYSGQGPALMTEYSVFGARYFLRHLEAESVSELRVHAIPMSDGNQVPKGFAADIGLFDSNTIDYFKLLVLRKSPTSSRPPLNYQLVWSGLHYEVWERNDSAPVIKRMLAIGDNFSAGRQPTCEAVTSFLSQRSKADKIFTVYRDKSYLINFAFGDLPAHWVSTAPSTGSVDQSGPGGFSRQFSVDETRLYDLSMAGSFPGQLRLLIDGDQVYSGHSVFEGNPSLTNNLAKVQLSAGTHVLTLIYTTPLLMSGSAVASRFGPIYLSTQFAGDTKVKQVSISRIPQLCTQNLDWLTITN